MIQQITHIIESFSAFLVKTFVLVVGDPVPQIGGCVGRLISVFVLFVLDSYLDINSPIHVVLILKKQILNLIIFNWVKTLLHMIVKKEIYLRSCWKF